MYIYIYIDTDMYTFVCVCVYLWSCLQSTFYLSCLDLGASSLPSLNLTSPHPQTASS